jgi:hypothetical protein
MVARGWRRAGAMALLVLAGLLSGCAGSPFRQVPLVKVDGWEPATVRSQFAAGQPESYRALHSLVFQYRFFSFTALGVAEIKPAAGEFSAVCMTPVGVKLVEVAASHGQVESRFVMEDFKKKGGDAGLAMGTDIARICLDLLPAPSATVRRSANHLIFSQPAEQGTLEFWFGGAEARLLSKRWYDAKGRLGWEIGFYDYRPVDGAWFPHGIYLRNLKYKYSLTIRAKTYKVKKMNEAPVASPGAEKIP